VAVNVAKTATFDRDEESMSVTREKEMPT